MAPQVELSETVKALAESVPLDTDALKTLTGDILAKADALGYDIGGRIVCGLDVNGPLVACDDNNLTPFAGAPECVKHLMDIPGVEVSLMTGWDLSTMDFFRKHKLKLPVGIVGEYGMVYKQKGKTRHLYPYREEERLDFMHAVLKVAAEQHVKIAFQGNYSPGSGAICVEADEHGDLLQHPLVKDRRPTVEQLYDALKDTSEAVLDGDRIVFENKPQNLKGIAEALFKTHPLISVRAHTEEGGKISIRIDARDSADFGDFNKVKEFAGLVGEACGRNALVYEDHGIDFMSKEAEQGSYSKDAGLREYGREAFGDDNFVSAIIGDKNSDIPRTTDKTLFFPVRGSDAEPIAEERGVPSIAATDVRDFALALAEAHRIKAQ